eukprot:UN11589
MLSFICSSSNKDATIAPYTAPNLLRLVRVSIFRFAFS